MTLEEKLKFYQSKNVVPSNDAVKSVFDKLDAIKNKNNPVAKSVSNTRDIFTPGNNYASLSKTSTASIPVTSTRDTLTSSPLTRNVAQTSPEPYKSEFGYGTDGFYGNMASKVANSFVADIPGQVARAAGQVIGTAYGIGESVLKRDKASSPKSLDDIKKNINDVYENAKKRNTEFGQFGEQIGRALPALPLSILQGGTEVTNVLYEGLKGNPNEALNYIAQKTKQNVPSLSDEQAFNYAITGNLEGDIKKTNNVDMARVWFGALLQAGLDVWQIAALGSGALNQYYAANQLKGWKPITSAQFKDGLIKVVDESGTKTSFNPKLVGRQGEITVGKPTFTRRLGEPVTNLFKDSKRVFIKNEPVPGQLANNFPQLNASNAPRPIEGQLRLNAGQAQLGTQPSPALLSRGVRTPENSSVMRMPAPGQDFVPRNWDGSVINLPARAASNILPSIVNAPGQVQETPTTDKKVNRVNTSNKSAVYQDLINEARKYKSAEDFKQSFTKQVDETGHNPITGGDYLYHVSEQPNLKVIKGDKSMNRTTYAYGNGPSGDRAGTVYMIDKSKLLPENLLVRGGEYHIKGDVPQDAFINLGVKNNKPFDVYEAIWNKAQENKRASLVDDTVPTVPADSYRIVKKDYSETRKPVDEIIKSNPPELVRSINDIQVGDQVKILAADGNVQMGIVKKIVPSSKDARGTIKPDGITIYSSNPPLFGSLNPVGGKNSVVLKASLSADDIKKIKEAIIEEDAGNNYPATKVALEAVKLVESKARVTAPKPSPRAGSMIIERKLTPSPKVSVATAVEPKTSKPSSTQQELDKIISQIKDKKWLEEVLPKQKTLQSKIAVAKAKLTIQGVKDKQSTEIDKERIKKEERAVRNKDERITDEEAAAARERILKGKNSGIVLSTRFAFLPSEIANYLDEGWQNFMGDKIWKGYNNFMDKLAEIKVPFNSGARYPFEYILGRKIKDLRPYERGRKKGYANAKKEALELAKFVGQFSDEEQAKMIDIITNRAYDSSELGVAAMRVEDTFVDIGIQLVNRGLLNEETFRSQLGSYFPRLYEEFEKGDRFIQQMWRKKIYKDFAKLKKDAYGVIYGKAGNKQVKKFQTKEERDSFTAELRANGKRYTPFSPLSEEIRAEKREIKTMTLPVLKRVLQERISISNYDYFNSMAENKAIARDKQDLENGFVDQIPEDRALYGDLAGMYVHRWYYSNIKDITELPNKANQFLRAVNIIIKGSKTILDPAVAITNAISNMVLADWAGVPIGRIDYWTRNLKESLGLDFNKIIKGDFSKSEPKGAYKVLLDEGILQNTSAGEDLQKSLKISGDSEDIRKALLGSIFDSGLGVIEIISELAKRGWIKAGDLYSFSENVAKSTAYDWGVNELGMSKDEAIQYAEDAIFDYSEVSNLVKLARKAVLGLPFPTFAAKMTEKIIETQIRKPFTVAKWYLMLALASAASLKIFNLTEDDMKRLRPDVSGNFFVATGVDYDKNGKLVAIKTRDLSRYFSFGGLTKMPIGIDSPSDFMAVPEFDLTKSQNILSAYTPGGMIFKPIGEAVVNKSKFTEKEIYNKDDDNIDIFLKITEHLGKSFLPSWTPGVGTLWDKYYNAATDKIDSSGAESKMDEAFLRTIGTKTTVINPETQYYFLNKEQQDIIDNEITKVRKLVISLNNAKKNPDTSDRAKEKLKEDIKEQEEKSKAKIQKAKEEMIRINKERAEFFKRTKKPR